MFSRARSFGLSPPVKRLVIGVCTNRLHRPPAAERILVVRLGALGDVVRTLPAVSRVRAAWPGAQLAWLVEPGAASALRSQAWIDQVIVFERDQFMAALAAGRLVTAARLLGSCARALRAQRFDLALDFHGLLRSALWAFASGARRRVAYAPPFAREGAHWFATHRARLEPRPLSRYQRNAGLVEFLGLEGEPARAAFELGACARARAAAQRGASGPGFAVLHPGSSAGTPYKRYPAQRLAEVARELFEREGLRSRVTRGSDPVERDLAQQVVNAAQGAAELAPETADLAELAELLAGARVVIGADTGPLHLASTVGTPVVQLLGPTDPVENAPWARTPSRQLRVGLSCSPCRRGCPEATCMNLLAPAAVVGAARELLQRPRAEFQSGL